MSVRVRSEVTDRDGTVAVVVDTALLDNLTPEQRADLDELLADAIAAVDHPDAVEMLAAEVTIRIADARAYAREAARRGVLGL